MTKVVSLLSGGMDSTTLLYWLRAEGLEVFPLSVAYGQRHLRELEAAKAICAKTGDEFKSVVLPIQGVLGGSALIPENEVEVPEGHYTDESMKATVVPNRNMILISVATAYAISVEAEEVAYGAHEGDHTIYPDCRTEFWRALDGAVRLCDWSEIRLSAPFGGIDKTEIVQIGHSLDVPYHLTWSCYKGGAEHCGKCGTCVERKEAFEQSGIPDPTRYVS